MDKFSFMDNFNDLISDNYDEYNSTDMSSGGTTGTTLKFSMDQKTYFRKIEPVFVYDI